MSSVTRPASLLLVLLTLRSAAGRGTPQAQPPIFIHSDSRTANQELRNEQLVKRRQLIDLQLREDVRMQCRRSPGHNIAVIGVPHRLRCGGCSICQVTMARIQQMHRERTGAARRFSAF